MLTSLPTRLPQLLVLIGLSMIVYSAISYEKQNQIINDLEHKLERPPDLTKRASADSLIEVIVEKRANALLAVDSINLSKTLDTGSAEFKLKYSLALMSSVLDSSNNNKSLNDIKSELKKIDALQLATKSMSRMLKLFLVLCSLGMMLIFVGVYLWRRSEVEDRMTTLRQIIDKPTLSEFCQSCGINFNSIVEKGTNEDGSDNYNFCKSCFCKGSFTEPELNLYMVSKRIKLQKKKEGWSKLSIFIYMRLVNVRLYRLHRWEDRKHVDPIGFELIGAFVVGIVLIVTTMIGFFITSG